MSPDIEELARRIFVAAAGFDRFVVAIAGPPGSGKSTLAEALKSAIDTAAAAQCAIVVPMDGFHFDDAVLEARGQRARKGAAFTFDVGGYAATLARIREAREPVAVPVFDRSLELSRAAARIVELGHRIVLTEGNYLLLREPPWPSLQPLYDLTISLDVPEAVLEARLMERWFGHGKDREAAMAWIRSNDLPNIRHVRETSCPADMTVTSL